MPKKHSDAKPAEKLLTLYTLLLFSRGRQFSLKELARYLDCSKQTIGRLVDQIEAAEYGKINCTNQGREIVYSIDQPRNLPQISLNAEGLYQLAMCRNLLLHLLPKGMSDQSGKTLLTAKAYTDECVDSDSVILEQAYTKGHIDYTPFEDMLKTFRRAMHSHKVCLVNYQGSLKRSESIFDFAPMRLIAYHETISLLGWRVNDKGRAEIKYPQPMNLYLHRCKKVEATSRSTAHLPVPASAQPDQGESLFGIINGEPFNVKALFAPEAATYVHERKWSSRQSVEIHENGSIALDFYAQSSVEVISWLLGFGERVTVLEPAWLRKELLRQARSLVEKYVPA